MRRIVPENQLRLPAGTRLLHVGPHKTGTTALQGALRYARGAMAEHGVVYPGTRRQHWEEALALTGRHGLRGDPPPAIHLWDRLVEQVAATEDEARVIVSSEFFGEADLDTARKIVSDLGGARVHVLVTLRPLTKIIPSAWQQYVRNGLTTAYDEWLDGMLRKPPYNRPTPSFWRRHHHDVLVARWASVVGPRNVTVLVLDESDRSMLTHKVEEMVGLPRDLLQPEPGRTNRSLTLGEIELVRHVNIEFKRRGWSDQLYRIFVRTGMTQQLSETRQPAAGEAQITTPTWALVRAAEIGALAAQEISALGVRVLGDISVLGSMPDVTPDEEAARPALAETNVPVSVATEAVIGTIAANASSRENPPGPVSGIPARELAGVLARRALRRATALPGVRQLRDVSRPDKAADS